MKKSVLLVLCVVICLCAGAIGSFFTASSISTWYAGLNKPSFNPPSWIFGPVWTILYILMGVSLFLVVKRGFSKKNKLALKFFGVQLVLNTLWSILFFGLRNPLLAFVDIILLWIFILLTILKFYRISKWSSYLLMPYILWVSFASVLNYAIWMLN
jgi:tryptophan-rich sensory protein